MSVHTVIFTALRTLVADRVYPSTFSQNKGPLTPVWPAIRYTVTTTDTAGALCGTDIEAADDIQIQLDVVAESWTEMRSLKASIIIALQTTDPPCQRLSSFEEFDGETRTHRASLDYLFQQSSVP